MLSLRSENPLLSVPMIKSSIKHSKILAGCARILMAVLFGYKLDE
jgi:hypothetical protein